MATRTEAKATRRRELLAAAARLMAERGFAAVRLEDVGREVGVSGPAMYRHFANKDQVLAELLIEVSERLHAGGAEVLEEFADPMAALGALLAFHANFAVTESDLIRIQDRDLSALSVDAALQVRGAQRAYVQLWADTLIRIRPELTPVAARVRVQAGFGLLNSAPHLRRTADLRQTLSSMARAALLC